MTVTRNRLEKFIIAFAAAIVMIICMMVLSCKTVWADGPEETPSVPETAAAETVSEPAESPAAAAPVQSATVSEPAASPASVSEESASEPASASVESAAPADSQETVPVEVQAANADQGSAVQENGSVQDGTGKEAPADDEKQDEPVLMMAPAAETVKSDAKAAGSDPDTDSDADSDADAVIDIRDKTVNNLRYDQSTGILSWDSVEGAEHYYATVSYKNESGMGSAFGVTVPGTSINIYDKDTFAELLEYVGTADYTFKVQGRADYEDADGATIQNRTGFTSLLVHFTPNISNLAHHVITVNILTTEYTYIKADNRFEQTSRARAYSQGGEVLINGESVNTVVSDGQIYYQSIADKEFRIGDRVTVSYTPADSCEFSSMKIDGKEVSGTQTITVGDKDIEIVIVFHQPLARIISNELEITSDNFEEEAQNILMSDMSHVTRWIAGYVQLRVNTVRDVTMPDYSRNICDTDPYLKSSKIKKGIFFNAHFYKSLKNEKPAPEAKTPKPVNIKITIPEYLKSTKRNIRRTFYLIKVHDGDASMIADSSGDTLSAYITETGLYMIGYKDTAVSSGDSTSGGIVIPAYAADDLPVPEEEVPEAVIQDESEPFISIQEVQEEESNSRALAIAGTAAVAAAAGAGIYLTLKNLV